MSKRNSRRHPDGVIVNAVSLEDLRARQEALQAEAERIVNTADEADRDLSDDELSKVQSIRTDIDRLTRQIEARESVTIVAASRGRQTTAEPRTTTREAVPAQPRAVDAGRAGFTSFGDFARAVRMSSGAGASVDNRLIRNAAPSTSGSEGVGADGGFAVPPDFRQEIWKKVMDEESLLSMAEPLTTGGNSVTVPVDETTPWQSQGGIQVYWENELGLMSQSKPALEQRNIRLNKLTALVPVSDELLEDAPGLDSYLRAKAPSKMVSKINTGIIRGTGVGQPLGIVNAPSLITVAKESGQAADTVLAANINKMWNRMYAPCRRNAVWLINQDIEPQLDVMEFKPGSSTPVPTYLPPGGLSEAPYARLKGRPVMPVEACSTLGDKGDIILVDMKQYMALTKGQSIKTDVSIHLFFDAAATAYRFIFRIAGQPWWGAAVAPQFGSATRSWAVTLEDRA
jgi:HK97 family phage major capsid protein